MRSLLLAVTAFAIPPLTLTHDISAQDVTAPRVTGPRATAPQVTSPEGAAASTVELPRRYWPRRSRTDRIPARVATAIDAGVHWLLTHQAANGMWHPVAFTAHDKQHLGPPSDGVGETQHAVGITGLAMLALLSEGVPEPGSKRRDALARAARWIGTRQLENGIYESRGAVDFLYSHAIATSAMIETAGMLGEPDVRTSAQRALDYIEKHRCGRPGWGYDPTGDIDTPLTCWCADAVCAGRDFGLTVPADSLDQVSAFFDAMSKGGRVGYREHPGSHSARRSDDDHAKRFPAKFAEGPTATSLWIRFRLGESPRRVVAMRKHTQTLLDRPPSNANNARDFFYWMHATLALFQVGGEEWTNWNHTLVDTLLPLQCDDGNAAGSWNPDCAWGEAGGRVYATAMALLALQAPYRFARFSELPPLPDGEPFQELVEQWANRDYGAFAIGLERLAKRNKSDADTIARARQALEDLLDRLRIEMRGLAHGGDDVLAAQRRLEEVAKQFRSLEVGDQAAELLKRYKRDKQLRREVRAAKKLLQLEQRFAKRGDALTQRVQLKSFIKSYGGTKAAARAQRALRELQGK